MCSSSRLFLFKNASEWSSCVWKHKRSFPQCWFQSPILAYLTNCVVDLYSHIYLFSQWDLHVLSFLHFHSLCPNLVALRCGLVDVAYSVLETPPTCFGCLLTQLPEEQSLEEGRGVGSYSLCWGSVLFVCDGAFRIMNISVSEQW